MSRAISSSNMKSIQGGRNFVSAMVRLKRVCASQAPKFAIALALGWMTSEGARAQSPTNPYSYSHTSSYSYYGDADGTKRGLLKTATVEPGYPQLSVVTTYDYDAYGNPISQSASNLAGASGSALFTTRSSSASYTPSGATQAITVGTSSVSVSVAQGLFPVTSTADPIGLAVSETKTVDPRFGAVLTDKGPSGVTATAIVDDFGRSTKSLSPDGTATLVAYCVTAASGLDVSSNSSIANGDPLGCPTPAAAEVPAAAVAFTHSVQVNTSGAVMSAFVRVYKDSYGRVIRTVTESFDGSGQASGKAGVPLYADSVYNVYGVKALQTQPYFASTTSSTTTGSGDVGVTMLVVDALGRSTTVYVSDPNGHGGSLTMGSYGSRTVSATSFAFSGTSVTTTTDQSTHRTEDRNALGELVRVTDEAGATLVQQRDAFGNLVNTKDALGNVIAVTYDYRGRKTQLQDPDTGTSTYTVDALGELITQQTPNEAAQSTSTSFQYDTLGRMTQRTEPEYVSKWQYDKNADGSSCMGANTSLGKGKLCQATTTNGLSRQFVYDSLGRPSSARVDVSGGPSFALGQTYESATGRLSTKTYPTGVKVGYSYTATRGYLEKLQLITSATVSPLPNAQGATASSGAVASTLWQSLVVNAWGSVEQQAYGNGVITKAAVEAATGRVTDLNAGTSNTVLSQHYTWDSLSNLTARADANGDGSTGAVSETFTYGDSLNRLTSYTVSAPSIPGLSRTVNLQYNALGMLLYKSDVGNYTYPTQAAGAGSKPHAVQSVSGAYTASYGYDANGNVASATAGKYRSVSYTSFNLPDGGNGLQGPSGSPHYSWQYDESHARIRETRVDSSGTRVTWYLHPDNVGGLGFESETAPSGAISNRHFLTVGGQVVGVLINTAALPTLATGQTAPTDLSSVALVKVEYWHKDQLGSLITTTDHTGAVTARYAYDPFGKRRYTSGTYDAAGNLVVDWSPTLNSGTDRGFTGQEHLDDIGVVHMNGRLFDPMLGVFMQANPTVGAPGDMQTYNRYGYCENNPLTCADPSGLQSIHPVRSASAVRSFARESSLVSSSGYIGTAATDFAFSGVPRPVIVPRFSQSASGTTQGGDGINQPTAGCCNLAWLEANKAWLNSKGLAGVIGVANSMTGGLEQEWASMQPNLNLPIAGIDGEKLEEDQAKLDHFVFTHPTFMAFLIADANSAANIAATSGDIVVAGNGGLTSMSTAGTGIGTLPGIGGGVEAGGASGFLEMVFAALERYLGPLALAVAPSTLGDESMVIYRAVTPTELADIVATGTFNPSPNGSGMKQFWVDPADAQAFSQRMNTLAGYAEYTNIVSVQISWETFTIGVPGTDPIFGSSRPYITYSAGSAWGTPPTLAAVNVDAQKNGIKILP